MPFVLALAPAKGALRLDACAVAVDGAATPACFAADLAAAVETYWIVVPEPLPSIAAMKFAAVSLPISVSVFVA